MMTSRAAERVWKPEFIPAQFATPPALLDPDAMQMKLIIDDARSLAMDGYKLTVEMDHYLVRIWEGLTFRDITRAYKKSLRGEPRDILWEIFGLRCWDDLPDSGDGWWGSGEMNVYQESVAPLVRAGLLLPPN